MAVDGTYAIVMQTPMGPQNATLVLADAGGSLSGSLETMMGTALFEGGTVDGANLTWVAKGNSPMGPMEMECNATLDGDEITGNAKIGSFGTATFRGQRE